MPIPSGRRLACRSSGPRRSGSCAPTSPTRSPKPLRTPRSGSASAPASDFDRSRFAKGAVEGSAALFAFLSRPRGDPTFFGPPTPLVVAAIAELTGATINDGADETRSIAGISSLDRAGQHDVAFIDNPRFASALATTRAGACFCSERYRPAVPAGTIALITAEPHRAFALVAAKLYPGAAKPE